MELREIVVLLVVGYSVAYAIDPILDLLERKKVSRSLGLVVILGALLVFVFLIFLTAVPVVVREYERLSTNLPNYIATAKREIIPLGEKIRAYIPSQNSEVPEEASGTILDMIPPIDASTLNNIVAGVFGALLQGYSITLTLINLTLLPFIIFYLAIDIDKIHGYFLSLFPKAKRQNVKKLFAEINSYVSGFVRGQLLVCTALFVLYAIGLRIVGIDLWFLMSVIAGYGNIVPYLGFLVGIVLSSIMALVTFGDFTHIFQVWIVFAIVQFLEGFVITPKIIGNSVGLSPLIVILAIFAGGQLFGLLGIFLAVPGAAVLKVLGKHLHQWVLTKTEA